MCIIHAMDAREQHVFVIDFLLSGKTPGELLAQKKTEEARAVIDFVRTGPDRSLSLTDPSLYARLQNAIIRLHMKGWV